MVGGAHPTDNVMSKLDECRRCHAGITTKLVNLVAGGFHKRGASVLGGEPHG